jgi:hypothetical protein
LSREKAEAKAEAERGRLILALASAFYTHKLAAGEE